MGKKKLWFPICKVLRIEVPNSWAGQVLLYCPELYSITASPKGKQFLAGQLSFDLITNLLYLPGFSHLPFSPITWQHSPLVFPPLPRACEYPQWAFSEQWHPQERETLWRDNPGTDLSLWPKVGLKIGLQFVKALRSLTHGEVLTWGSPRTSRQLGTFHVPQYTPLPIFCLLPCSSFQRLLDPSPLTAVCAPNLPSPLPVVVKDTLGFPTSSSAIQDLVILPISGVSPSNLPPSC